MTDSAEPERREPNRIVVQASDHVRHTRGRRARKNLHEPCPDQITLFDPPAPENQP